MKGKANSSRKFLLFYLTPCRNLPAPSCLATFPWIQADLSRVAEVLYLALCLMCLTAYEAKATLVVLILPVHAGVLA